MTAISTTSSVTPSTISAAASPPPAGSAWGAGLRSCDGLLRRLECNDPALVDLVVLPGKTFGSAEVERLAAVLESNAAATAASAEATSSPSSLPPSPPPLTIHWRSLAASSHRVPPDALRRFGRALAASRQLQSLAIGDESMGDAGLAALCRGLLREDNEDDVKYEEEEEGSKLLDAGAGLRTLDLSYKGLTWRGLPSLLRAFGRSEDLEVLNLARNDFSRTPSGDDDAAVAGLLLFPRLEDLDLSKCQMSGDDLNRFLDMLHPRPRILRLSQSSLGVEGFRGLLQHAAASGGLRELHASGCHLGDTSLALLPSALPAAAGGGAALQPWGDSLRVLDLSGNAIGEEGAASLAQALTRLPALAELHLAHNPLGETGILAIVAALRDRSTGHSHSSQLDVLDMSDTHCTAKAAAAAVNDAGAVRTLRLFDNRLGSEGFLAVADTSLRGGHPALEGLDLAGNGAGPAAVVHLLHRVAEESTPTGVPSTLRALVVGGNGGGQEVEAAVARVLEVHPGLDVARDVVRL